MSNTRLLKRDLAVTRPRRISARSTGTACLIGAIAIVGLLPPVAAHGQQADSEILSVLADMVGQKHNFKPEKLHAMGADGLSALLDYLLPETAQPKKLDLPEHAVANLIEQLGDDNYQVRQTASDKLYQLGPAVKPFLVKATRSEDAEVGWRARRILRKWETELKEDKSRYLPALMVYVMGIQDDQRLKELLSRAIMCLDGGMPQRGKQQILTMCISAVARSGKEEYTNQLKPLLKHEQVQVAALVTRAVGSGAGGTRFPSLLLDALQAQRQEIVTQAINAASNCTDESRKPDVERLLIAIFEGDNDQLKFQVCMPLMQSYHYEKARDYLLEQLQGGDRSRQYQALSRLRNSSRPGKAADEKLLQALAPLLKDKNNSTRRMACYALASYSGESVVEKLIPLLADSYSSIPREVTRCLVAQPDKKMVRRLLAAAAKDDPNEKVRKAAEAMLKRLGQ